MEENNQILSKYIIIRQLGKGSQGAVYLAVRKTDNMKVAIKIIKVTGKVEEIEKEIDKSLIEIELLKTVSAEPECNVYISCYIEHIVDWSDNKIYLVMEYIDGPNLKEYVEPLYETQDSATLIKIVYETTKAMAIALKHVHNHGILHQDIKPENIVVDKSTGIPKLVDFGLACQAMAKDDSLCIGPNDEEIGICCVAGGGTYSYLAPERIIYDVRYPQSDVWSLGATMYSLITGKIIWGNRDPSTTTIDMLKQAIYLEEPEELNSGIDLLDNLINDMTMKNITKRLTIDKILYMLKDQ